MAKYEDLAPLDYFGSAWADKLVAVGWVESADQCSRGEVDRALFESLVALLVEPWQPFAVAGSHRCTLCRFTGGPSTLRFGSQVVEIGASNLFVPSEGCVFVAPSSVVHYIDAHQYCPPLEFQEAVRRLPAMRSMEYLRLIRKHELHRMSMVPNAG